MVSLRCKILLQEELERIGIPYKVIVLGQADIEGIITDEQYQVLNTCLLKSGLEILNDPKAVLVERIKSIVIEMIYVSEALPREKFSYFLSHKLYYNYTYLANIFSELNGITLEHFIIYHKIERVKELISYNELNLKEIAFKMGYSSASHLSTQFKRVTGISASSFKLATKRFKLEDLSNCWVLIKCNNEDGA